MPCTVRARAIPLLLASVVATLALLPASSAGAAKRASTGCGRAAAPGVTTRRVAVDGTDREYLLAVPGAYDAHTPAPLVFNFHGFTSNMQEQAGYTHLGPQAGQRGYVVITPNGRGDPLRGWSLFPLATSNPDVAFVQRMLRLTARTLCIDPRRVYATGMSNGAMFSTVLACALPGRLAAIAPVAGINATGPCDGSTPRVSVLALHGTGDPIVPYQGGDFLSGALAPSTEGQAHARPVNGAMAAWASFDGCGTPPVPTWVADDVQRIDWRGCPANGTVELYRILGGGHTWPGATPVRELELGTTTPSISATELILDFFDAHPRES
jgi:polyhydroxybutyrate depolymerase